MCFYNMAGLTLKQTIKRNLFGIITIAISAIILLIFLFANDGIGLLQRIAPSVSWEWLAAAVLLAVSIWFIEGITLNIFCKILCPQWSFRYSFNIGLMGILYSALTPFSTGGQPMQIFYMKRLGMDVGRGGSVIAMKTLVYQVIMVLSAILMVVLRLGFFQREVSNFSFLTIIGILCNGTFITLLLLFTISRKGTEKLLKKGLLLLHRIHLCKDPEGRYKKINAQLLLFHHGARLMGKNRRVYVQGVILTVLQIFVGYSVPYCLYRSFGFCEQDILTIMAAQAFVSLVSAFVPLPGASGGAEGSFYLFFSMFFTNGTIVPAVVLWRVLTYYFNIAAGAVAAGCVDRLKPIEMEREELAPAETDYLPEE